MKIDNFFSELKRRNVIRAAGLYLVGAWLLTQVASTVLPMFGAPDWLPRSIVILLAIGFLPALIFSWAFELTPHGLKRDAEVAPEQSIAPQTGRRMNRMIIAILVLALAYFGFDKFILTQAGSGEEVWSENYTRNLKDVFAVQTELAQTIVEQLRGQLTAGAANPTTKAEIQAEVHAAEKGGTKNVEAHEAYLQGRFFINRHSEKETDQARAAYQRAAELDPKFALGWAGLAQTHVWDCNYATGGGQKGFNGHLAAAREAVERALALQPHLPEE